MTATFGCENCRRGFPHSHAVARNSDPETSHDAADSVDHIRESQAHLLAVLAAFGPLTDEHLYALLPTLKFSPSGARTRRAELVALGKVRDSGRRERLASGRWGIAWEAVTE